PSPAWSSRFATAGVELSSPTPSPHRWVVPCNGLRRLAQDRSERSVGQCLLPVPRGTSLKESPHPEAASESFQTAASRLFQRRTLARGLSQGVSTPSRSRED